MPTAQSLTLLMPIVAWQVGQKVDKQLSQLGAHRLAPFGCGDEDSGKMPEQFQAWGQSLLEAQSLDADAVKEPIEPVLGPEVSHSNVMTCHSPHKCSICVTKVAGLVVEL